MTAYSLPRKRGVNQDAGIVFQNVVRANKNGVQRSRAFGAGAGWRKARPVSGELRLRNGAAEKRTNGGCKSWFAAKRSEVKHTETRRSQVTWAAQCLFFHLLNVSEKSLCCRGEIELAKVAVKAKPFSKQTLDENAACISSPGSDCSIGRNHSDAVCARTALSWPVADELATAVLGCVTDGNSTARGGSSCRWCNRSKEGIANIATFGRGERRSGQHMDY